MDKVLVFTNEEKWENIQDVPDRVNWNNFTEENKPFMECVVNSNNEVELCPVTRLSHAGIYLVYDDINMVQLKPLLDSCPNDNLYVLIHNHGRKMEDFNPWHQQCIIKKGMHENFPRDLYLPAFDINTDTEGNKLERIIDKVFTAQKEAVLELLNECLVPKKKLKTIHAYQLLCENGFESVLEVFRKKYETCNSFDEYKQDLVDLRKKLGKQFKCWSKQQS